VKQILVYFKGYDKPVEFLFTTYNPNFGNELVITNESTVTHIPLESIRYWVVEAPIKSSVLPKENLLDH
jgi:hypothetical protein